MALAGTRVLIVEDDAPLADALRDQLEEFGCLTTHAESVAEARRTLGDGDFEVALLDLQLPDGSGIDVLKQIVEDRLLTEAVVLTGYAEVSTAIQAIKLGAYDYLSKPARSEELELSVRKAAEKARLRRENLSLRVRLARHEPRVEGLVTEDKGMRALIDRLERAAQSELPILIEGESGTGKELFARAAHEKSRRSGQAFVAFNCAAVPENLLESELFGHEKGAFTGAANRKPGLFEVADGGTLFLDEVGEVSPSVQVKLLRAIEQKEFFRVGGTRPTTSDVRVVAATNRDLASAIEGGEFREDLYYRLNGVTLKLPPLRERRGDILPLALHFLREATTDKTLAPKALEVLQAYAWPGNVRELQMVIRRAAILAPGDAIGPEDVVTRPTRRASGKGELPSGLTLVQLEEMYIKKALAENGGHRGQTAKALGIDVKTLYNKLGAERPRRKGASKDS
jgi:DNA-binding NtrC family response regulator